MRRFSVEIFSAVMIVVLLAGPAPDAQAQWPPDGAALCTAAWEQWYPKIIPDGSGGAIVTWQDRRGGADYDIYIQRVDGVGVVQWASSGVAVCTATGNQFYPTIASDGAGGAIVTWMDERGSGYDIYAQHVDAAGNVLWATDGVALCAAIGGQQYPRIAPDGTGGAIVAWHDLRSGINDDIYAQRVDGSGIVQWTTDGVALCTAMWHQYMPTLAPDGAGGAIVTWEDGRSGSDYDIYAQRVDASGVVQWTTDGVALCTATGGQGGPGIVSDGGGGAIVAWWDYRSGYYDIYAQRVGTSGVVQWAADGVALCTATGLQDFPNIVSDGAGGAIVTWEDFRSSNFDIYEQRVDASGTVQWTTDGVALCTATGNQRYPTIASDGAGGAIVTWQDGRSGNDDTYAQRTDASGISMWTADGVALCTAAGNQEFPTIASDGTEGAIVTWQDGRSGNDDIYAQRVMAPGYRGQAPAPISALAVVILGLAAAAFAVGRLRMSSAPRGAQRTQ